MCSGNCSYKKACASGNCSYKKVCASGNCSCRKVCASGNCSCRKVCAVVTSYGRPTVRVQIASGLSAVDLRDHTTGSCFYLVQCQCKNQFQSKKIYFSLV